MKILDFAESKFGEVDVVVSVFSMQIIWASDEFYTKLDYSMGELDNVSIRKVVSMSSESLTSLMSAMLGKRTEDERSVVKKNGERVMMRVVLETFTYEKEPYVAIKML